MENNDDVQFKSSIFTQAATDASISNVDHPASLVGVHDTLYPAPERRASRFPRIRAGSPGCGRTPCGRNITAGMLFTHSSHIKDRAKVTGCVIPFRAHHPAYRSLARVERAVGSRLRIGQRHFSGVVFSGCLTAASPGKIQVKTISCHINTFTIFRPVARAESVYDSAIGRINRGCGGYVHKWAAMGETGRA